MTLDPRILRPGGAAAAFQNSSPRAAPRGGSPGLSGVPSSPLPALHTAFPAPRHPAATFRSDSLGRHLAGAENREPRAGDHARDPHPGARADRPEPPPEVSRVAGQAGTPAPPLQSRWLRNQAAQPESALGSGRLEAGKRDEGTSRPPVSLSAGRREQRARKGRRGPRGSGHRRASHPRALQPRACRGEAGGRRIRGAGSFHEHRRGAELSL